jgi:ABC-2 type transport system ATP-binding protein
VKGLAGNHTVVLSTHILPEVEQTCHRVIIIDRGKIVAVDTPQNLRSQIQGATRIFLEVQGPAAEVVPAVAGLPGVLKAGLVRDEAGSVRLQIDSDARQDIRTQLARLIVNKGWGLLELHSEIMSLEDIFIKLTTAEETVAAASNPS